jgi:hypothetical protein
MSTYLCAALASRLSLNSTSARGLGIASWGTDLGHFERKREFVRSRSSMNSTRSVFLDFERVSCNRSGVLLFSSVTAASAETHSRDNSTTEDTSHAIATLTCDQKLASDSSGLPGGFSGQRAWVRIFKKWAPGSYCLELVVACPAAGTSAQILLVEGK